MVKNHDEAHSTLCSDSIALRTWYAHARSAYKLGDTTAAEAGRMTLNPLAHRGRGLSCGTGYWAKPVPTIHTAIALMSMQKQCHRECFRTLSIPDFVHCLFS